MSTISTLIALLLEITLYIILVSFIILEIIIVIWVLCTITKKIFNFITKQTTNYDILLIHFSRRYNVQNHRICVSHCNSILFILKKIKEKTINYDIICRRQISRLYRILTRLIFIRKRSRRITLDNISHCANSNSSICTQTYRLR